MIDEMVVGSSHCIVCDAKRSHVSAHVRTAFVLCQECNLVTAMFLYRGKHSKQPAQSDQSEYRAQLDAFNDAD